MFSSLPRSFIAVLLSGVLAVSAKRSLSLQVSGPQIANGVHELTVVATLTNTGNETLKLLNDPRSVLDKTPANTFVISDDAGSNPSFNGVKVKYVPDVVASSDQNDSFTILSPGQSVEVEHDLSLAYNFTAGGETNYTVGATNLFLYVDPATNTAKRIFADTQSSLKTALFGSLAVPRSQPRREWRRALNQRALFHGCNDDQISGIMQGVEAAKSYAAGALSYLQSHSSSSDRYSTWWGAFTDARHNTLVGQYSKISGNDFENFKYNCDCPDNLKDAFAFVSPDEFGTINLCGAFWPAPAKGTDSKGGTIVHESSHFTANAGTEDTAYGQSACKDLAKNDPDGAIGNADSHEYFAENNPAQS